MAGAFVGQERRPRDGFALVEHPDMPGEVGEIPVSAYEHWFDLGFRFTASPFNPPTPQLAAEDTPDVPEGDPVTVPQED